MSTSAPPSIDSVGPSFGPPATRVMITGRALRDTNAVHFNATPASSFDVIDDMHVVAIVPPAARTGRIRLNVANRLVVTHDLFVVTDATGRVVAPATVNSVAAHRNVEKIIRYYLAFLPPRDAHSILDIGAGVTAPYRGVLRARTARYASLDIRPSPIGRIDYVCDITQRLPFDDAEWHWGWCTETLEHVPPDLKLTAAREILRVCHSCVFTYPTPAHPTFAADPGHTEVTIDWLTSFPSHAIVDATTSTGRAIIVCTSPDPYPLSP